VPAIQIGHREGGYPAAGRGGQPRRRSVLAVSLGAVAVIAIGSVALGQALDPGGPLSILGLAAAPTITGVPGTAGLSPGGPAQPVSLLVTGAVPGTALPISAITVDGPSLPVDCPPDVWTVAPNAPGRVSAGADIHVAATVALTDDAPTACQGATVAALTATITVRGPGGTEVTLSSTAEAPITIASLGTPTITVGEQSGQAVVLTTTKGPALPSTRFVVEAADADGNWTSICRLFEAVPCATGRKPGASGVRYRVTATLGTYWRRESAALDS
jgi:hypothetical protein